jgi:hypothetical protein
MGADSKKDALLIVLAYAVLCHYDENIAKK